MWQFAETNQGLLSLVALVVALIFGLYEYRTNKRAGLVQRREYIAMVSGVIDEMLNFTSDLRARFGSGEILSDLCRRVAREDHCAALPYGRRAQERSRRSAAGYRGQPVVALAAAQRAHRRGRRFQGAIC